MGKLAARRAKAQALQRLVVESLAAAYDRLCASLEEEFAEGLGIGNVLKRAIPLLRDKDFGTWLKDLQRQFESRAKAEIEDAQGMTDQAIADAKLALQWKPGMKDALELLQEAVVQRIQCLQAE